MEKMEQMIRNAEEALLGNERVTAELDDAAADVLLNWGIALVRTIIRESIMAGEGDPEEVAYPRLRANRRMLREVSRWCARRSAPEDAVEEPSINKIIRFAEIVYGPGWTVPSDTDIEAVLVQRPDLPADAFILAVRGLLEGFGEA